MVTDRPPRDLTALLSEVRVPEDIDRSLWAKAFREHLRKLDQKGNETLLDFVIVANVLRTKASDIKFSRSMKWRVEEINRERRELLQLVGNSFFSENSETPIALGNRALREDLCEALAGISDESAERELDHAFELIWQARCDFKVWKNGLDRAYILYLGSKPSLPPSALSAVLLSIM